MSENKNCDDKSLDEIIEEITLVNSISFDTWYQALTRRVFRHMPLIKLKNCIIYEVNDETGSIYIGPERRRGVRLYFTAKEVVSTVKMNMMPRTLKIEKIDE